MAVAQTAFNFTSFSRQIPSTITAYRFWLTGLRRIRVSKTSVCNRLFAKKMTNQPPTTCIVFGTQHAHACIVAATSFVALMPAVQLVLKKKSHSFSARMRLGYPHVLYNTGTNHRLKKHPSCMANPFHLLGMNQPVQELLVALRPANTNR